MARKLAVPARNGSHTLPSPPPTSAPQDDVNQNRFQTGSGSHRVRGGGGGVLRGGCEDSNEHVGDVGYYVGIIMIGALNKLAQVLSGMLRYQYKQTNKFG